MALISSTPQMKYDVFLSFRGDDTRNTFTGHLCKALCDKQIETSIDDKQLNRGDEISPSLLSAIEESHISIVVFSKNYASSRWCLEELVKIVECWENHKQIVIPVFYEIDPTDVRNQTGSYAEAFAQHEQRLDRVQRVQTWKNALKKAADLSGFDSRVIMPESVLVNSIVDDVLKKLENMSPSYNTDLPGMNSRIKQIESLLRRGDVRRLGLWGIGGIGKTTLVKEVSKKISCQFESSCLAVGVREYSKQGELDSLRKDLLSKLLEDENAYMGTAIEERLGCKKLLIILDDVTDFRDIGHLIGDLDCLTSESLIIVTSRDKQVLQNCRLHHIYHVEELCFNDALKLFCQYAFRQNRPKVDYKDLSNNVVEKVGGVPLALESLGFTLFGKKKKVWDSVLKKLENNFDKNIHDALRRRRNIVMSFVITNLVLELSSALLDQVSSSANKTRFAFFGMLISFVAMFVCILEFVHQVQTEKPIWRWRGTLPFPWYYYQDERRKPFGTFKDIVGLVCAFCQCVVAIVSYCHFRRHTDSPIKISIFPIIFAFGILFSQILKNQDVVKPSRENLIPV